MLVSILHRATGTAMAIGGGLIFTWWLVASAMSADAYKLFYGWVVAGDPAGLHAGGQHAVNILARLVGIGLTWSLFQHMASGVRHFIMDTGSGFELRTNKMGALLTIAFSVVMTLLVWALILAGKN